MRTAILIPLFLFSLSAVAVEPLSTAPLPPAYSMTIDVSDYKVSPLDIKASVLRALIDHNWEIVRHERDLIRCRYKRDYLIEVSLKDGVIVLSEVERASEDNSVFRKWFASLREAIVKDSIFRSHLRQAESMQ